MTLEQRFKLKGKVAAIVGGTGYLGSALGRAMAESGMTVYVLDLPEASRKNLTFKNTFIGCDATSKEMLERAAQQIVKRSKRVDVLLNAAGVNAPTPFLDIQTSEIDRILQSHVHATLYGCQVFGAQMLRQKSGSIINFASVSSGPPLSKAFIYSVAKAGVANLTQNLAREWAPYHVRVNALRPGFFPTQWSMKHFIDKQRESKILGHTPMGRYGKPDELAGATLWLASEAASFVTGAIISVDGGFTAMTL
jgi:NAD(P)-dependent dehydrogenase (short-subunit alcohol dehydrogenase family)